MLIPSSWAGYRDTVLADGPSAYWRLSEASGTNAADETANGNAGTYFNGVTLGASGALTEGTTAVSLDGADDYVKVANAATLNPTSGLTLEAWVKPTSGAFSTVKPVFVKGHTSHAPPYYQYAMILTDTATYPKLIQLSLTVGGALQQFNVANSGWQYGAWNHIAATYDGANMRIYLNGSQVGSRAQTGSLTTYSTPLAMGCFENLTKSSTYCYKGGLDEAAVYASALSAERLEAHYLAGTQVETDPPENTTLPSISGSPSQGRPVTASPGVWDNNPTSYAYQWRRCDAAGASCVDISGADESAYTLDASDAGSTVRVAVTATNSAGSNTAVSDQTGVVGPPPENTVTPMVAGTTTERHTLTATSGAWTNSPTRYSYQWLRCDGVGSNCTHIHEEIADVHTLTSADVGSRLKVLVTAINQYGETTDESADTAIVGPGQATGNATFTDKVLDTSPSRFWGLGETSGTTGAAVDQASGQNGSYHPAVNGNTLERGAAGVPIPGTVDEAIRVADVANISGGGGSGLGYVSVPGIPYGGTTSFSVNVWIRWAGYRQWVGSNLTAGIIGNLRDDSQAGGWGLLVPGGAGPGKVSFHRKTPGSMPLSSPNPLPTGKWTMVTATYDGSTEKLFENGDLVASRTSTTSLGGGYAGSIFIGKQDFNKILSGYWGYFEGSIDEPAIWTRALGDDEVASMYVPPVEPPAPQAFGTPGGCNAFACNPSGSMADPVNTATGGYYTTVTDVALPGIGVPFRFTRTYNSGDFRYGPLGQGWTHSLDAGISFDDDDNASVRAPDGQRLRFLRQPDGSFVDASGGRSTLESTPDGYELELHNGTKLVFDGSGRLTSQRDRHGQGLALDYDADGQLQTVTDAAGRTATFTYTDGLLTSVLLEDGRSVDFSYDAGLLESVTDVRGGTTSYDYNASGRLTSVLDQNAHTVVENLYGDDGRVVEQEDAHGHLSTFDWDPDTQTATTTDARGKVWEDIYFANVLQRRIDPLGNATRYEYDEDLSRVKEIDPRGNRISMTHDARGNLLTRTAPAPISYEETFTYDADNNLLSHENGVPPVSWTPAR